VLDALTYAGRRENLDGLPSRSLTFVHGDIRDGVMVAQAMDGCDVVFNFAAESHVDRSIEAPGEFIQTDVSGVFVLCEQARRQRVRRFVQSPQTRYNGEVLEGLRPRIGRCGRGALMRRPRPAGDFWRRLSRDLRAAGVVTAAQQTTDHASTPRS